MMQQQMQLISPQRAEELGLSEPDKRMYYQLFLINKEYNNAAEPEPWKINDNSQEKITKSFVGKPLLVPPKKADGSWYEWHIRAETPEELFEAQKGWTVGEIVHAYVNPETGNSNAVVEIFPEYEEQFRRGDIPRFTSPMVDIRDETVDHSNIVDASGIHLQMVPTPGYRPEVSGIQSVCEAGISQCMKELRIVAASGDLKSFQEPFRARHTPNKQDQTDVNSMSSNNFDAKTEVEKLQTTIKEQNEKIERLVAASGQQVTGVDIIDPTKQDSKTDSIPINPDEAAKVKELQKELAEIKKEREDEIKAAKEEEAKRKKAQHEANAKLIVESRLSLKELEEDKKDETLKSLIESKDDLSLLAKDLEARAKKVSEERKVGASGFGYQLPELGGDSDDDSFNAVEAMGKVI